MVLPALFLITIRHLRTESWQFMVESYDLIQD
jgi:hypothetical protein